MKRTLFIVSLVLTSLAAHSTTYYFDINGNTLNDGKSKLSPKAILSEIEALGLQEGDSILLHGDQIFDGPLELYNHHRIYLGSYDGTATVRQRFSANAIVVRNSSYCILENIKTMMGRGAPSPRILFEFSGDSDNISYRGVTIKNLIVDDSYGPGISVKALARLDSLRIINCKTTGSWINGIEVSGNPDRRTLHDVVITNCKTSFSKASLGFQGGVDLCNGMLIQNATNVLISGCEIDSTYGGPYFRYGLARAIGMSLINIDSSKIINCLVHDTFGDEGGLDQPENIWNAVGIKLSGVCAADTIENCKTYNNHSAGYSFADLSGGNILMKNCSSVNDASMIESSIIFGFSNQFGGQKLQLESNYIEQGKSSAFVFHSTNTGKVRINNTKICLYNGATEFFANQPPPQKVVITKTTYPCLNLAINPAIPRPVSDKPAFSMSPNPMTTTLQINVPKLKHESLLRLIDASGRISMQSAISAGSKMINISNLSPGVYIAQIIDDYRLVYSKKLLKL
jgi:hypothetical protein